MKRSIESTPDLQGMARPMVVERSMLRREAVRYHRRSAPNGSGETGDLPVWGSRWNPEPCRKLQGRREPNHSNERSVDLVQEVKVVAGVRNHLDLLLSTGASTNCR